MKKVWFVILMAVLMSSTCKKDRSALHFDYDGPCHCGVENPLEELDWLYTMAEDFESSSQWATISTCLYGSAQQGFIVDPCVQCADGMQSLFDCQGNLLGNLGGITGIPLSEYDIDPSSVCEIYRNYPDTAATLTGKRWQLQRFFDRETNSEEMPVQGSEPIAFWLCFHDNGVVEGGGVNHLGGNFFVDEEYHIHISIAATTEMYDATGWENRMLDALNDAMVYHVEYYGKSMRIYYDMNRKWMDFVRVD
ncbi:MAG: META domain-containing protein [Bacteroidales bacterium]|nr:META domain-containing protein [Bacteroidales bacterium]